MLLYNKVALAYGNPDNEIMTETTYDNIDHNLQKWFSVFCWIFVGYQ